MNHKLNVQLFSTLAVLLIITACRNQPGQAITVNEAPVLISGAMHQVMNKGQLQASISLDTIRHKENLCGLGPIAYLAGEITVVDGKAYRSTVVNIRLWWLKKATMWKLHFSFTHTCPIGR